MNDLLDQIVDEAIDQQPSPSPFADKLTEEDLIESNGETVVNTVQEPPPFFSSSPQPTEEHFNPEIHATDAFGNPRRNKNGTYSKKRGRKNGQTNTQKSTVIPPVPDNIQQSRSAAVALCTTMFILCKTLGGDEWTPVVNEQMGVNEPGILIEAWTQYFMTVGVTDIPPWIGVVIATTSYVAPRFTMPQTQSRLGRFWNWCKSWWSDEQPKNVEDKHP